MSNITHHWSGTADQRGDHYTIEIGRTATLDSQYLHDLRAAWLDPNGAHSVDFVLLKSKFNVWKNHDLSYVPSYDTWNWNHDPRDNTTPNICIASLCLPHGATDFSGEEPFTIAHAWAHAYAAALVAAIKNLDCLESWPNPSAAVYQNGPMFTISTHAERAIQTIDWGVPDGGASSQAASQEYGYFFGSGDPQSRADLFCLDAQWYNGTVTIAQAKESAAHLRAHSHVIKGGLIGNKWGIDQDPTA
jgi:hypothetical protein